MNFQNIAKENLERYLSKNAIQNEQFKAFLVEIYVLRYKETFEKEGDNKAHRKARDGVYNATNSIKAILKWRNLSIEEFIENGEEETSIIESYIDIKNGLNETTKRMRTSITKRFLRFLGYETLFMSMARQSFEHFPNDVELNKHIELDIGLDKAKMTHKSIRLAIARFSTFRGMTPTELVEEVNQQEITIPELRDILLKFRNSLELKDKITPVNLVRRFYEFRANLAVSLPPSVIKKKVRKLQSGKKLTKKIVQQLLDVCDLRDKMIIYSLFESGLNGIELVNLSIKHFYYQDDYGNKKSYLDIESPEEINDVCVIKHIRQKTPIEFYACFGRESLRFISKWLKARRDGTVGSKEELTDETAIFCTKKYPYQKLSATSISNVVRRSSELAGFSGVENYFTPADFRNHFNTTTKAVLKPFDKEVFMGHVGGIERHYDISDEKYFRDEYRKAWEICFDMSFDNEKMKETENYFEAKVKQLEKEIKKRDEKFIEMKIELEEIKEQREADDQEQQERLEILAEQEPVEIRGKLTQEEMLILKKLIAKVSS